jgi:broad specificity phosphatase PhoE
VIELIAVRHGQSTANVAFPRADAAGSEESGLTMPDAEVPLTPLGRDESAWLARRLATRELDAIVTSPYARAIQTSEIILTARSIEDRPPLRVDERLRDREWGALEMMTRAATKRRYPQELERRAWMGDFRYRPPGGESMADVALRIRGFLADAQGRYPVGQLVIVGHDATVAVLRYVLEELTEDQMYGLGPIRNASVTRWVDRDGRLELAEFNATGHLQKSAHAER